MAKGNKNPSHKFPVGNTIAKDSGNMRRKRIRKSPMRKTLVKFLELEPYAVEKVEKSLKEDNVDKESLATAKWLISSIMQLSKAVSVDEDILNGTRLKMDAAEAEEAEKEEQERAPSGAVFSLFVNEAKKDKE